MAPSSSLGLHDGFQFFLLVAAVALGQNVNGVFLPDESLRNESINARSDYDLYRYFDRDLYGAP